jgi:hypothetical protein
MEYWEPVSRTEDLVIIREIQTGILYAWTKKDGWHQYKKNSLDV